MPPPRLVVKLEGRQMGRGGLAEGRLRLVGQCYIHPNGTAVTVAQTSIMSCACKRMKKSQAGHNVTRTEELRNNMLSA